MLHRLFKTRPEKAMGQRLYLAVVAQARQPELYAELGVEDRIDSRFDLYTAHVVLVLRRLRGAGDQAGEVGQALFDAYLSSLDHTLRELGVGDLSVSKKMRRLGETIYAQTKALDAALDPEAEPHALTGFLRETFFGDDGDDLRAERLAAYIRDARDRLTAQPTGEVMEGSLSWPKITA